MDDRILALVGPTASGKTALAIELASAIDAEIVSVDSVQLYAHFDIGSGKPSAEELARIRHHLIGVADPLDAWDASRFAAEARRIVDEIQQRGKRVVLCGGTYLWLKALVFGLVPAPPKNDALRAQHLALAETHGRAALHERLTQVDSEAAARLNPNDFVRVSRALEVYELTGQRLSELQAGHGFQRARYPTSLVGIHYEPAALGIRIEKRVQTMLNAGWEAEVRRLIALGYRDTRAMQSVGYRQVLASLDAENSDRSSLAANVTQVTRVFARRQRTWLRDQPVLWLPGDAPLDVSEVIRRLHAAPLLGATAAGSATDQA